MRFEFPQDFGLIVPAALALLSLRLFRRAAQARSLPEALVGVYFLAAPFAIAITIRVDRFDAAGAAVARTVANGLFTLGGVALLLFAWRVFRPADGWARTLACVGSLALVALWASAIAAGAYDAASFFLLLPALASYFWVFVESVHYYQLMRRRARLMLADPVLTNRFLLFAIWTGGVVAITVLSVAGALFQLWKGSFHDGGGLGDPILLGVTRVLAVPIATAIWLTFLAPARYHRWLMSRARIALPEP
jgi:hypothetical protein